MITEQEFIEAANIIGCSLSAIKAVYQVEANGSGYLDDGFIKGKRDSGDRVKILFEGHRFWKQLVEEGADPKKFLLTNKKFENVLYKKWNKKQYYGGSREWSRMSEAIEVCKLLNLDPVLALRSASYGSFQIMGENAELCGYTDAHQMLSKYNTGGESEQLKSFIRFVKSKKLDDELRNKNWSAFAEGYNGSAYRENQYDTKLYNADKKFAA